MKKTVILVAKGTSKEKIARSGTTFRWRSSDQTTHLVGTDDNSTYNAAVVTALDKGNRLHIDYISLKIMAKKSSKSLKSGAGKSIQSRTGKQ